MIMAQVVEPEYENRKTCPNCDKTIGYNDDEVRLEHEPYENYRHYLTCPNCKKEFIVKIT